MRVLVHLNHGINKSYMLDFGSRMNKNTVKQILRLWQEDAAQAMFCYASLFDNARKIEISNKEKGRAEFEADFVVGHQGYVAEKLA